MSLPKVSVALCTRNGERFLKELLNSLAAQTLPPAEVVACDDASGDATPDILEEFARRASFPVYIHTNPVALGVTKNFECAIRSCSSEFIALADQDDVWHIDKLSRLTAALSAPTTQAVFSDAAVVNAELAPLGYGMWQRVGFTPHEQRRLAQGEGFAVLLKHQIVTGATLGFKIELCAAALPIPDDWPHDAWLALIAASQGGLATIDEPLIAYRQHGANTVGGMPKPFLVEARDALRIDRTTWYREELSLWRTLAVRLETRCGLAEARAMLAEKISHIERRSALPAARWRRIRAILNEVTTDGYSRFARNWGSTVIDLLVR